MVIINKPIAKRFRQEKSKKPFVKVLAAVLVLMMLVSVMAFAIPGISAKVCNNYFTHQETIYIDMTGLTDWDGSGANIRVYSYYGDSNDDWNVENNKADSACYTNACFQNAINPTKISDHLYSFNIQGDKVGYVKVLRLASDMNSCWNSTGYVYADNRSGSQNCIKITGWDNSYQWTTYSAGGDSTGYHEVTAKPDATSITNNSSIFPIDATFYDYYTDTEVAGGWGNINYVNSHGDWEPYQTLNNKIAAASSGVNYPMYFGNFFDKNDGYTGAGSSNMVNFSNWVNNSARLGDTHKSVVGLTGSSLVDGDLMYAADGGGNSGVKVPFFDKSFLQTNGVGSVVNTKFPMRKVTSNGITTYVFDSTGAQDNAWFSADHQTMYYGTGTANGAKDALYYYSNPQTASGYGFFPFDSNRGATKEAYNFAFGMRVDIPFNLGGDAGHYGQIKGTNGSYVDQKFTFSGDDDVWVYIDGKLVLDLGGDHQKASGSINFKDLSVSVSTGSNTLNNATRNTSFTLDNYGDPTAEHTLTMFYVERGMVESNLSFDFNFAPIGNELIVDKTVNTTTLNNSASFRAAVAAADTFTFNQPTANGKQSTKGTISGNTYTLKNAEYISFKDQFEVPTSMAVTEESYTGNLSYSTTWKAVDLVLKGKGASESAYTIGSGSGTQSSFTYQTLDTSSEFVMTRVQLSYVNTPNVGSFSVEKKMATGSTAPAGKTFPATIYLQFKSDAQPAAYTLVDDDGNTCTNGRVNLVPGETISFSGIPTGTRVYVVEDSDQNYTASYNFTRTSPYIVGTSSGNITVTNTPNDSTPTTAVISGTKKLDDTNYIGTLFNFVLEGVPRFSGDPSDVKDTSSTYDTTNTVTNGAFSFGTLNFTEPGTYRYHVYEDMGHLLDVALDENAFYDTDIFNEQPDYLVSITVRDVNFELVADAPVYYDYSRYEADGTTPHTMTSADFAASKVDPLGMIFYNETQKGSITINKTNQSNQKVNNVIFEIYPVSDDFIDELNRTVGEEAKYEKVLALGASPYGTGTGPDYGFADGVAEIENLPIYKTGYQVSSAPEYQQYVMIESGVSEANVPGQPNARYSLNKTVYVFSFPTEDSRTHEMKYHYTYDYVNGVLKTPSTAGPGMTMFKIIGCLIAALAVLSLGGYVIYTKRTTKRKTAPKHVAK